MITEKDYEKINKTKASGRFHQSLKTATSAACACWPASDSLL